MRDFPQEIIEQIIDCSVRQWTDSDARKICGLVCRAWLHRTRFHLFSTVTLIPGTLRTFVDIIGTSFLPILPLIRHLRLHYIGQSFDVTLLQQVHCCPNLASIRIAILDPGPSFGSWGDWLDSPEVHLHLRSWSANAVSLSRFEIGFGGYRFTVPVSTITFLLSCFPSLDTAVIYDYFRFGTFEDECAPAAPPHLAHLELSGREKTDMLFSWLISLPVLPHLKTIKFMSKFPPAPGSKFEALEAYVRRAGGELENLTVKTSGLQWEDTARLCQQVFQHTINLQNFTFTCPLISCLLDILPLLPPSSKFNSLVVNFDYYSPHVDLPLWTQIDDALADSRFRGLRRFSVCGPVDDVEYLPLARARGILI